MDDYVSLMGDATRTGGGSWLLSTHLAPASLVASSKWPKMCYKFCKQ